VSASKAASCVSADAAPEPADRIPEAGPDGLRRVFRRHVASVAVITAWYQGSPVGLLVTSLASVSVEPPLISFNVARTSSSWPALHAVDHVGVHVLDAGQQDLADRFARKGVDRFSAPTSWQPGPHQVPLLEGVAARGVAEIEKRIEAGDHMILIAHLRYADARDEAEPLVHHDGEYHRIQPGPSARPTPAGSSGPSGTGSRLTVIRTPGVAEAGSNRAGTPGARTTRTGTAIDPESIGPASIERSPASATGRPQYASPVDRERYGEYRITQDPADPRPRYRFTGRLIAPASARPDTRFVAEPGRFHLYSGWFCPWAQRSTLVVALAGLEDVVSVSYVDGKRDARGWAFRESTGPDPVNGFTLLREAYEATEPGFDGHVSVPTLWDRQIHRVATNDYGTLDADLATAFGEWSRTGVELYPEDLREEIDTLERWLRPTVNRGVSRAKGDGAEAHAARHRIQVAFAQLEQTFAQSRYLLGDRLTLADVRLFVTLVRYDRQANAAGRIGPPLPHFPNLWAYARDLFQQKAFRETTRFDSFTAGTSANEFPNWDEPVVRAQ